MQVLPSIILLSVVPTCLICIAHRLGMPLLVIPKVASLLKYVIIQPCKVDNTLDNNPILDYLLLDLNNRHKDYKGGIVGCLCFTLS